MAVAMADLESPSVTRQRVGGVSVRRVRSMVRTDNRKFMHRFMREFSREFSREFMRLCRQPDVPGVVLGAILRIWFHEQDLAYALTRASVR